MVIEVNGSIYPPLVIYKELDIDLTLTRIEQKLIRDTQSF